MQKKETYGKAYFAPLEAADQGELPRNLRILVQIEKYIKKGKLLDVGVGSGLFLRLAASHGFSVQGLDISSYAIHHIKRKYKIDGKIGKLENIKYSPNYFDAINLRHTIEHLDNPEEALKQAFLSLKPGGVICISTPNSYGFHSKIYGKNWPHWCLKYHKHFYSKRSLARLLRAAGFEILEAKTEELSIFNSLKAILKRLGIKSDISSPSKYSLKFDKVLAYLGLGEGLTDLGRKPG